MTREPHQRIGRRGSGIEDARRRYEQAWASARLLWVTAACVALAGLGVVLQVAWLKAAMLLGFIFALPWATAVCPRCDKSFHGGLVYRGLATRCVNCGLKWGEVPDELPPAP